MNMKKTAIMTPVRPRRHQMKRKKKGKVSNILPLFFFLVLAWFQKFLNQSLIKEKLNQRLFMLLFMSLKQITNCVVYFVLSFFSFLNCLEIRNFWTS